MPDQEESTCYIGDAMVYSRDISSILEDTYGEILVEDIDRDNLIEMAGILSIESAKIVFSGNEILSSDTFSSLTLLRDEEKENFFGSKYKTYEKMKLVDTW